MAATTDNSNNHLGGSLNNTTISHTPPTSKPLIAPRRPATESDSRPSLPGCAATPTSAAKTTPHTKPGNVPTAIQGSSVEPSRSTVNPSTAPFAPSRAVV